MGKTCIQLFVYYNTVYGIVLLGVQQYLEFITSLCSCIQLALFFLSFFFLICGDTHSLRMSALSPASQAGPMHNPREGTSVVLRNTIRQT